MERGKHEFRETTEKERGWWLGPGGSSHGGAKRMDPKDVQVVQAVETSAPTHQLDTTTRQKLPLS